MWRQYNDEDKCQRLQRVANFLGDVRRAGSWHAYVHGQHTRFIAFRSLHSRGRALATSATTPPVVEPLLALPNEMCWHVLGFAWG